MAAIKYVPPGVDKIAWIEHAPVKTVLAIAFSESCHHYYKWVYWITISFDLEELVADCQDSHRHEKDVVATAKTPTDQGRCSYTH